MQTGTGHSVSGDLGGAAEAQIDTLLATNAALREQVAALTHQLDWFKRQLFGARSEKRHIDADRTQLSLGEILAGAPLREDRPGTEVKPHRRQRSARPADEAAQPFFDESRVPIETIVLPCPLVAGLTEVQIEERFECIGDKHTYRLAQRPGSFVVLKYERPQYKERTSGTIGCAPAPEGVIDGSRADVSFIAAMVIDKIAYHLPLYRQHQRLINAGFRISRPWLTQLIQKAGDLLEPVYQAQFDSVRASRVKAMDETPIRAGLAKPGTMNQGYFWPVYGELDEVCFAFHPSRQHRHAADSLGLHVPENAVLLSDGYGAYEEYAAKTKIRHARCWSHLRRYFVKASSAEPEAADEALQMIAGLYRIEARIKEDKLDGQARQAYRAEHAVPIARTFFA